ncbi:MAG: dynamin family protein [Verrucomicrobiota bacterium JB023]|nr:dynamin family protein [Verrucomicrobiota bacterium JB023]
MIGERYFATRARLSAVVEGVRKLAGETGTELGALAEDAEGGLLDALRHPVFLAVCGEVNAGKSSFLNALFGEELCPVNVLPETKTNHWYLAGGRERDVVDSPELTRCVRRSRTLLRFNCLDTPGTTSSQREQLTVLRDWLPDLDLVFFIFPVSNPWGAATWDFIANLPPQFKDKLILVLQQKDERSEKDLEVMVGHMKDLAIHKIGEAPDVFPVSAKLALEAGRGEERRTRIWKESGYETLENFVSSKINWSFARRQSLRNVWDAASQLLRDIEDRMESRRRMLDADQGFLREIELEVDRERERHARKFAEKFSGLREVFSEQAQRAAQLLRARTTLVRSVGSLFSKDETPAEIEKGLVEAVKRAVEAQSRDDSEELVETCRAHWLTVIPRVEERLEMPAPDFDRGTAGFSESRERFSSGLGRAARSAVVAQKFRGMLDVQMEARREKLRRAICFCLVVISLSGGLGAFHLHWPAVFMLVVGLVVLIVALVQAKRSARELVDWFEEKASSCRVPFSEALAEDYEDGVRGFFVEYATLFEDIRRHVAKLKMKLKPQLDQWNDHFLELRAIEQDF